MRSEKKQVIEAGQRPSDRSALVLFLAKKTGTRAVVEVGKRAGRLLLRGAEITTGGRSTLVRLSMFDSIAPRPSWRNGLSFLSICPDVFDENIVLVVGQIPATKPKEGAKIYLPIDDAINTSLKYTSKYSIQRAGPAGASQTCT